MGEVNQQKNNKTTGKAIINGRSESTKNNKTTGKAIINGEIESTTKPSNYQQ
jgi:hypothetical protein